MQKMVNIGSFTDNQLGNFLRPFLKKTQIAFSPPIAKLQSKRPITHSSLPLCETMPAGSSDKLPF
jgi:hypothetical protein